MGKRDAGCKNPKGVETRITLDVAQKQRREYAEAVAGFRCAVSIGAGDGQLWNGLEATVANGGESDDALRTSRCAVYLAALYAGACPLFHRVRQRGRTWRDGALIRARAGGDVARLGGGWSGRSTGMDEMRYMWRYLRCALNTMDRAKVVVDVEEPSVEAF